MHFPFCLRDTIMAPFPFTTMVLRYRPAELRYSRPRHELREGGAGVSLNAEKRRFFKKSCISYKIYLYVSYHLNSLWTHHHIIVTITIWTHNVFTVENTTRKKTKYIFWRRVCNCKQNILKVKRENVSGKSGRNFIGQRKCRLKNILIWRSYGESCECRW